MIKHLKRLNTGGHISVILGPILLLCIALATVNMMLTYKGIHHEKQATLWSVIQLDREISNTLFSAGQYINGQQSHERLHDSYKTLADRFPDTISTIGNDKIFQQVNGLSTPILNAQQHVDGAEKWMKTLPASNKTRLNEWSRQLNKIKQQIDTKVLDIVASTKGDYSEIAFKTIIKTAGILLALILTFIVYLVHLLLELRRERKRNLHMLAHDPLTGLSSRECIMTSLQSRCNNEKPFALLLFDLNKFKAVNDNFGHHAGDQLLIHLAEKFKQTLSKYGIVGRLGGDEFVWLAESDNPAVIEQQHALFLESLKEPCVIKGIPLKIHVSSGGGIAAHHAYHPTQLLERVDEAMYRAKARQIKEIVWEDETSSNKTAPVISKDSPKITSVKRPELVEC